MKDGSAFDRFRIYDLRRCLYTIVLPRGKHPDLEYDETPYAHVDTKLLLSTPAIFCTATLPVYLMELISGSLLPQLRDEVRPHHTLNYVFDDQWHSISGMLTIYPFGVVFDMRGAKQLISTPDGHIPVDGAAVSVADVIPRWLAVGDAAIARVAEHWPDTMIASLRAILTKLRAAWPTSPRFPVSPSVTQDCFRPNAIIRNLAKGYWADSTWNHQPEAEVELSDPRVVQHKQHVMAEEIIASTRAIRDGAKPEAMVIAPAVNPALVSEFFARVRASGIRSLDKTFLDACGYLLYVNPRLLKNPKLTAVVSMLMHVRGQEKTFYDAVGTAWASSGHNVVFRTPHLPGRLFNSLDSIASMDWSQKSVATAMKRWREYCKTLTNALGPEQLKWITKNVDRLTVMSDLPIEWSLIDGVPLGFLLPISRIPMAPGNFPIRLLVDPRGPILWTSVESTRVLIVDGHEDDDPMRMIPGLLAKSISNLGFRVEFERIRHASQLEEVLRLHTPNILYLSSHGEITKELGGALALPDGPSQLAAEMEYAPDVAIVSACRSDPLARTYSSPARNLFGAGVRGVLASYLNLTEPHALMVTQGIFTNLYSSLRGDSSGARTWEQLVWKTLNSRRPLDIILACHHRMRNRSGSSGMLQSIGSYVQDVFAPYTKLHNQEGIPFAETWHLVGERLCRVAKGTSYESVIRDVVQRRAFRPESMFYTQIGEPQRILIQPAHEARQSQEERS